MASKNDFIGSKILARGAECDIHICCHVISVQRACGHVDALHYGDNHKNVLDKRRLHRATPCGDCECMAEQGFVILDNQPAFRAIA